MKKLLSVVAVFALLATSFNTFAAYGGGGAASSIGGSSSSMNRDDCPDGDNSGSYYDGTCGDAEETPAEETPAEETPAEETPTEETPSEETPTEENGSNNGRSFLQILRERNGGASNIGNTGYSE